MGTSEDTNFIRWVPFGYLRCDRDGLVSTVNPALSEILDRPRESLLGHHFSDLLLDGNEAGRILSLLKAGSEVRQKLTLFTTSKGKPTQVLLSGRCVPDSESAYELLVTDTRERMTLEQELRQAQKLDAIGRLAGGMAHDFNNLLMIVQGRAELALKSFPDGDPGVRHLYAIHRTATRAESLTRQLLAFSRNQALNFRVMSINDTVSETRELIKRWLGEDIDLRVETERDLWPVRGDTVQMQQVLINLVLNARDAMPKGGTLRIRTANIQAHSFGDPKRPSEDAVVLEVRDSGRGMDSATIAMAFEPFFTTKGKGKGTGLGLSTAYGVITQSQGSISITSSPEEGTTFHIHLPRTHGEIAERPRSSTGLGPGLVPLHKPGIILLVEAEHDLRLVIRSYLEDMGHHVIAAADAEAVLASMSENEHLDLLLTDVVLPAMSGPELAVYLREEQPDLSVIFMSSFPDHPLTENVRTAGEFLLVKPFTRVALESAVGDTLDAPGGGKADGAS